jgi:hypothetical protein
LKDEPVDSVDPLIVAAYAEARDQGIATTLWLADAISDLEAMELTGDPELASTREQTDVWIATMRTVLEQFELAIRRI